MEVRKVCFARRDAADRVRASGMELPTCNLFQPSKSPFHSSRGAQHSFYRRLSGFYHF